MWYHKENTQDLEFIRLLCFVGHDRNAIYHYLRYCQTYDCLSGSGYRLYLIRPM